MKLHSDYTYELVGPVLCIVDLDLGAMSVTNNIENVMSHIKKEIEDLGIPFPPIVIYRDSDGMWDGVEFVGSEEKRITFYPLQKKDRQEAIDMAKQRWVGIKKGASL